MAITTTTNLIEKIAEAHDLPKTTTKTVVEAVLAAITAAAKTGEEVSLNNFGKFKLKEVPAREARNPATGATIKVAASKKLVFVPGKVLKDTLNSYSSRNATR